MQMVLTCFAYTATIDHFGMFSCGGGFRGDATSDPIPPPDNYC